METIGSIELRQNMRARLQQVQAGETFVVTRRGRPVAKLVPIAPTEAPDHPRSWIWRKVSTGGSKLTSSAGTVYGAIRPSDDGGWWWWAFCGGQDGKEPDAVAARWAADHAARVAWYERQEEAGGAS